MEAAGPLAMAGLAANVRIEAAVANRTMERRQVLELFIEMFSRWLSRGIN